MNNSNKEIDLSEFILKIFIFIKKYIIVLGIALILGFALGKYKTYTLAKNFSSEMIIIAKIQNDLEYKVLPRIKKENDVGNTAIVENIIKSFQKLLSARNYEIIEKRTGLSSDELKQIISVSPQIIENDNSADFDYISVTASVKNTEVLKKLSQGIVNYVNNNQYIKQKNTKDSLLIAELILETNKKIQTLEMYQAKTLKPNSNTELMVVGENSVFSESVNLAAYKQKLEQEMFSLKTAQILEEFFIPKSKTIQSSKAVIIYPFVFLIIAFIVVGVFELNKKSKTIKTNLEQKQNN